MDNFETPRKRNTAYKLRIGDLLKAKPIINEGKLLFLELGDKKISRINIIANVIDKYVQDGEKKFASLTIDDASGQIKLKNFGEDIKMLQNLTQGDTIQIIGLIREYNSEIYIQPEIAKSVDAKWLLVRKLEIQNSRKDLPTSGNVPIRDTILQKIKSSEANDGIDVEQLILDTEASPDLINGEIQKLISDGLVYEPRPGIVRYLG
jgi:RecG-like helicase